MSLSGREEKNHISMLKLDDYLSLVREIFGNENCITEGTF